jgi:hypothetical protein
MKKENENVLRSTYAVVKYSMHYSGFNVKADGAWRLTEETYNAGSDLTDFSFSRSYIEKVRTQVGLGILISKRKHRVEGKQI